MNGNGRPIFRRFPSLRVPFVRIAELPTPVGPLKELSRALGAGVWVKRDDRTHRTLGGGKIRKLEFLRHLAERDGRAVVAYGPHGSNWLHRLARVAEEIGVPHRVYSFPQHVNASAAKNVSRRTGRFWRRCHDALHFTLSIAAEIPRALGRGVRVAPMGGSDASSALGYVNAGLELAEDVRAGRCPAPEAVYVPLGTGATAAGLALGLSVAGLDARVVAVRVTVPAIARRERVQRLAAGSARLLGVPAPRLNLEVDVRFFGGRYAVPTDAARSAHREFLEREGFELDHSYTAPSAAALLADVRAGKYRNVLFWNTGGSLSDPT